MKEKLSKQIKVNLTEKEYDRLIVSCIVFDMSISKYVRELIKNETNKDNN